MLLKRATKQIDLVSTKCSASKRSRHAVWAFEQVAPSIAGERLRQAMSRTGRGAKSLQIVNVRPAVLSLRDFFLAVREFRAGSPGLLIIYGL